MGRACTICSSDNRHAIEAALTQREPYRHIASRYGVSTAALQRHKRDHLPGKMLREDKVQAAPHAPAHEGKIITQANSQAAPHARAREGLPNARVRAREGLQAKYLPQLADLEREASALQRRIEDLRRDLQARQQAPEPEPETILTPAQQLEERRRRHRARPKPAHPP
jgi:hypothetical protein